jgi:hypothetical protein
MKVFLLSILFSLLLIAEVVLLSDNGKRLYCDAYPEFCAEIINQGLYEDWEHIELLLNAELDGNNSKFYDILYRDLKESNVSKIY